MKEKESNNKINERRGRKNIKKYKRKKYYEKKLQWKKKLYRGKREKNYKRGNTLRMREKNSWEG